MRVKALQLAQLVDEAPDGDDWFHEQKFDGYRIVAEKASGSVELLSRRFNDWTTQFPTVVDAVAKLDAKRAVLDGEVAVVMPDGRTSFQALQNAFGKRDANIAYFVFDLLELDGKDLTSLPLEERKKRLRALVGGKQTGVIRYSDHVVGQGKKFFQLACKRGLEGIVSKRRDSKYHAGRGKTWVKTKCLLRQELVIAGYTDPEGARTHVPHSAGRRPQHLRVHRDDWRVQVGEGRRGLPGRGPQERRRLRGARPHGRGHGGCQEPRPVRLALRQQDQRQGHRRLPCRVRARRQPRGQAQLRTRPAQRHGSP